MCGCENCAGANGMHAYIFAWYHCFLRQIKCDTEKSNRHSKSIVTLRHRKYKYSEFPRGESLQENSSNAANATMCTFHNAKLILPH